MKAPKGISPGITSGTAAATASKALAAAKANVRQVPLYTFHIEGLTAEQANREAAALALRISRRELILSGDVDILPETLPTRKIKLQGSIPDEFTGDDYFLSGYTHRFTMPRQGSHNDRVGLVTEIKALNLPTQALAAETAG